MYLKLLFMLVLVVSPSVCCPLACTCREEHFVDLPISRYTKHTIHQVDSLASDYSASATQLNNVLYDDEAVLQSHEDNPLLRAATCVLQAESEIEEFISKLPHNVQALTFLVMSSESENRSLKMSYLEHFEDLTALEIRGEGDVAVEIGAVIPPLKYLNLEKVILKEPEHEHEQGMFAGLVNLVLLRVCGCQLFTGLHWEMFSGLQNVKYLMLEEDNIKFIPSFAFYGTPNVRALSLARNELLNIEIEDLAGLLDLEYLDLSGNNFTQLSELSFPPFPKLKQADFRDNPITVVYPNTFDVMNTTDSIVLGDVVHDHLQLRLMPNSFLGLGRLRVLTLTSNVHVPSVRRELFAGMSQLRELRVHDSELHEIEFDAFAEVPHLSRLILTGCGIRNVSMDAFYGLEQLLALDLSNNRLTYLPPNVFDQQTSLTELLLNGNDLSALPEGIFDRIHPVAKLIRLNDNPWHCSCGAGAITSWRPTLVNVVKQRAHAPCDARHDKGLSCAKSHDQVNTHTRYVYMYENRVAPKCNTPHEFTGQGVFQVIRRQLRCKKKVHKIKVYQQEPTYQQTSSLQQRDNNEKSNELSVTYPQLNNTQESNDMPTTGDKRANKSKQNEVQQSNNIPFDTPDQSQEPNDIIYKHINNDGYVKKYKHEKYMLMKLKKLKLKKEQQLHL